MNNRIIKFRAWDKEKEKMFYKEDQKLILEKEIILMQFIGLSDKNGKEIYEGDLLKNTTIKPQIIECFCTDKIIGSAGFAFNFRKLPNDKNMMWRWEIANIEVIGNIFENPNLLK